MMPGYQASDSENAYDFFFTFLFSIRPTDPISGNAFDGKQKKKKRDEKLTSTGEIDVFGHRRETRDGGVL